MKYLTILLIAFLSIIACDNNSTTVKDGTDQMTTEKDNLRDGNDEVTMEKDTLPVIVKKGEKIED